jgi:hypothetical protein
MAGIGLVIQQGARGLSAVCTLKHWPLAQGSTYDVHHDDAEPRPDAHIRLERRGLRRREGGSRGAVRMMTTPTTRGTETQIRIEQACSLSHNTDCSSYYTIMARLGGSTRMKAGLDEAKNLTPWGVMCVDSPARVHPTPCL